MVSELLRRWISRLFHFAVYIGGASAAIWKICAPEKEIAAGDIVALAVIVFGFALACVHRWKTY